MDKQLGVIIASFVTIIVGIVLIMAIADNNSKIQTTTTVTDDQFTMSNTTCVQITSGCIASLTSVENVTQGAGFINPIATGNYSLCTVYNRYDGILVTGDDQVDTLNGLSLNATYQNSDSCMYVADGTSRTLVSLIVLFFAIAIMVGGVYYLRQTGLLDWF